MHRGKHVIRLLVFTLQSKVKLINHGFNKAFLMTNIEAISYNI